MSIFPIWSEAAAAEGHLHPVAHGGADVEVFATASVEGEASGGSNVRVVGDPDRSRIDTSGGADVDYDG